MSIERAGGRDAVHSILGYATSPGSSSFTDFLASAAPGLLPRGFPAAVDLPHGTTIVAAAYADGVVMAGDRRATAGNLIAQRDIEKVFAADEYCLVGIAGTAGLAVEIVRLTQRRVGSGPLWLAPAPDDETLSANALAVYDGVMKEMARLAKELREEMRARTSWARSSTSLVPALDGVTTITASVSGMVPLGSSVNRSVATSTRARRVEAEYSWRREVPCTLRNAPLAVIRRA